MIRWQRLHSATRLRNFPHSHTRQRLCLTGYPSSVTEYPLWAERNIRDILKRTARILHLRPDYKDDDTFDGDGI